MKVSHGRQRQVGIALTYIQMAFSILVNIICTPIILKKLGQSEYGLYNLTSSIISYLSLLTLGFGASYIRFYSRYKAEKDEDGIQRLNGLYMIVFLILGAVALVGGLALSFNSKILFNSTYSAGDLKIAKVLMLLLTFNMAISFPMSVYTAIISSQERFIFQKIVNIGKTVIAPVMSIVVIFFGFGSIGMVVVTTIVTLFIDFVNIFYCHKKIGAKFRFGKIDGRLLKEIAVFSIFIAINQLIDQLNMQTDKVILGKMINASAVAIYAIAATIQTMYLHFSTAVNSVFAPKIHRIINSGEKDIDDQLTDLFIKIGRVQYFILMLIMTGFIFFGQYFIKIWAGEDFKIAYYLVLILMIPSTVPLIQNIGIEIQRAKNKHQFRSLVYLLVAIINVAISIVLCKFYGIVGVTIGTAFANIVGCIIIMNIYYHKKIGLNIIKFWKSIFRASLGFVIPIIAGVLVMRFIQINNIFIYLSFIAIYSILYLASIYVFGMNREERVFIKKILCKIKSFILRMIMVLLKPYFMILSRYPKDRVIFISFWGTQYSDNPKAVSEHLHEKHPEIKQVYLLTRYKELKDKIPNYVKCKKMTTFKKYYYISSSKVIVDNDALAYMDSKNIVKSNKQIIIETWHGDRGFKKCFKCANNEIYNYRFATEDGKVDYFVTGSTFAEKTTDEMFNFKGKFLKVGSPRNDILFNIDNDKYKATRQKLGIDEESGILLYAPTYRSYQYESKEEIDFDRLIKLLEKKTKKNWVVVYRSHHRKSFSNNEKKYIDGRYGFGDMADLLPYVDMLITDYSSCAGDFLLTGKGVILYLKDYIDFEKLDKGFFFDIKKSPYLSATNNEELFEILNKNNEKSFRENSKKVLEFYGSYEDGNASKKIVEVIVNFLNKK